jgi:hypothetical protein
MIGDVLMLFPGALNLAERTRWASWRFLISPPSKVPLPGRT